MDLSEIESRLVGELWTRSALGETMRYLCDACGGRFAGSPDERRAGDYLLEQLCAYGVENVHGEEFDMRGWERGPARLTVSWDGGTRELPCMALAGSPPGEAEAELIDVGPGTPAHFEGVQLSGKAVLASAKGPHRLEKYARCQQSGASVFLFGNARPGMLISAGSLGFGDRVATLPGVGLSLESAAFLRRRLEAGPVHVRAVVKGEPRTVTARNIVAELPGSDPEAGWIVAGAHYDGHDVAQGAQDNATGTAVILEAARGLARERASLRAGVRFVLFSGEEMGMYGSAAYVRAHKDELDAIRTVYNADIVGLASPVVLMVQNSPELLAYLRALPLDELGARVDGARLVAYSDHFSFTVAGLASLMAVTSRPGEGHGWAHTAADTLDKIDMWPLREAAVTTARLLLRMAAAPGGLPASRQSPEAVRQALVDAGLEEPLRIRGEWPF